MSATAADGTRPSRPSLICLPAPSLVERLAAARIGETFNQYTHAPTRWERLAEYLVRLAEAPILPYRRGEPRSTGCHLALRSWTREVSWCR